MKQAPNWLFVLLMCALSAIGLQAQESTPLTIFCSSMQNSLSCEDRLMTALQNHLAPYSVDLITESEDEAALRLTLGRPSAGSLLVTVAPRHRALAVSPVVARYPQGQQHIVVEEDDGHLDTLAGLVLYELGRCDEALQLLPTSPDWTYYEVICTIADENLGAALRILQDQPKPLPIHEATTLAWLYIQTGDPGRALETMQDLQSQEDLLEASADSIEIYANSAQIYALTFDYASALENVDRAIALAEEAEVENKKFAALYTLRGEIVLLTYEWDAALADFNTALAFDANYAPAYFQRGILYYTQAQRENALADFQTYLELTPDGVNAVRAQQYIESIEIELEALNG